jgi:hypothetical protein
MSTEGAIKTSLSRRISFLAEIVERRPIAHPLPIVILGPPTFPPDGTSNHTFGAK